MKFHEMLGFTIDPRSSTLPLINTPLYFYSILVLYLFIVLKWGPSYMKYRKSYDLKTIITLYNLGQIYACFYIFKGFINAGFTFNDIINCPIKDYSQHPKSVETLRITYLNFLLKLIDCIETIFFVLRKKQNQISNLHIFHHISTANLMFMSTKYLGGTFLRFPIAINSIVHIIMYCYYILSQYEITENLVRPFKKYITIIQMIQFTAVLGHIFYMYFIGCEVPIGIFVTYIPTVSIIFYMFYNFYQKSYKNSTTGNSYKIT